jgi:hypothetical protein
LAVNVQAPAASIANVPFVPTIVAAVNVLFGLSTSVLVSVPLVDTGALVSKTATSAELTVAASFVPLIVIFTELAVPSTLVTLNVSFTL